MTDVQAAKNLIQEIKQIIQQYQIEVGSKGKPWPKSVKTRTGHLFDGRRSLPQRQLQRLAGS